MLVKIADIKVPEERQRKKEPDLEALANSLKTIGLINPITITQDLTLIAGWSRLHAAKQLGWLEIEARLFSDLSPDEQELIEFEENVRREALGWIDQCKAVMKWGRLLEAREGRKLSIREMADRLGWQQHQLGRYVTLGKEIEIGNQKVLQAPGIESAYNIIKRAEGRLIDHQLSQLDLVDIMSSPQVDEEPELEVEVLFSEPIAKPQPIVKSTKTYDTDLDVAHRSMLEILPIYQGPKFNFIHCDFPYGVGMHDSEQAQSAMKTSYEDTPELYFELLNSLLEHRDRIMLPSCHILFWFSMDFYRETLENFQACDDLRVFSRPLIWHKSDLKGIVPDVTRQPRWTYETALFISRGDRKIIAPVAASHAGPTARPQQHISQKPQPVLEHFFRMFVDDLSIVLDPTCGSGTALCAADRLGAQRVQGWELESEFVEVARSNLRRQRLLSSVEGAVAG